MEMSSIVLALSAVPMSLQDSLQDSGKAVSFQDSGIKVTSPQDCDAFDPGDFVDSDDEGLLEEDSCPQNCNAFDYGDFVDSDDEGLLEEETEPAERYDLGLYYPICIGDVLVRTYRI